MSIAPVDGFERLDRAVINLTEIDRRGQGDRAQLNPGSGTRAQPPNVGLGLIRRKITEQEDFVVIAGLHTLRERPDARFRLACCCLEIGSAQPGNEDGV